MKRLSLMLLMLATCLCVSNEAQAQVSGPEVYTTTGSFTYTPPTLQEKFNNLTNVTAAYDAAEAHWYNNILLHNLEMLLTFGHIPLYWDLQIEVVETNEGMFFYLECSWTIWWEGGQPNVGD